MRCGSGGQRHRPSLRETGKDLALQQEGIPKNPWRRQLQILGEITEG